MRALAEHERGDALEKFEKFEKFDMLLERLDAELDSVKRQIAEIASGLRRLEGHGEG